MTSLHLLPALLPRTLRIRYIFPAHVANGHRWTFPHNRPVLLPLIKHWRRFNGP